ncbi:MAG: hypothetical protein U1E45_14365 [Geminicoccaceae bacterium]
MSALSLDLEPEPGRPGFYRAMLGARCLTVSRQPFFDAARVLLRDGADPNTEIRARHVGANGPALRSTVGEAARWTVKERDRGGLRREPYEALPSFPGAVENETGADPPTRALAA